MEIEAINLTNMIKSRMTCNPIIHNCIYMSIICINKGISINVYEDHYTLLINNTETNYRHNDINVLIDRVVDIGKSENIYTKLYKKYNECLLMVKSMKNSIGHNDENIDILLKKQEECSSLLSAVIERDIVDSIL
jgi:hypothetical protein